MCETADVGVAVHAFAVADGNFDNFEVLFGRAKEQVVISKWVEVSKEAAAGYNFLVVFAEENFGAAEGVAEALFQKPGEGHAEEFIAQEVEEAHGLVIHLIDEAGPVDKFPFAFDEGVEEFGQVFRGDGEVRVQNHEDVARSCGKPFAYGIAFASAAALVHEFDVFFWISVYEALNFFCGAVCGVAVYEDEFGMCAQLWGAQDSVFHCAAFVAAGNDDGAGIFVRVAQPAFFFGHEHGDQAEVAQNWEPGQEAIAQACEERNSLRKQETIGLFNDFEVIEVEEVFNVFEREPVLITERHFQANGFGKTNEGFPEVVVVVHDDAGVRPGHVMEAVEEELDVIQVA